MRLLQVALIGLIQLYRWTLAPVLGANCRFAPSCSEYAREAIARHGAFAGSWLAAKRLLRCHPWGPWGYDPVPEPPLPEPKGTPPADARSWHR